MSQFEYNDLRKFYVSIGAFLIGLTFVLPWLFFRESFDLLIKESDLKNYTDNAQTIITQRQLITSYFLVIVLVFSVFSLVAGLIFFFKGIKGWRELQRNNEQMEKLKIEYQQLENKKITLEIERIPIYEQRDTQVSILGDKTEIKEETVEKEYLTVPINNTWKLNHWGSDVASILDGKMIFSGTKTRLETEGSHINLKDILKIGKIYKVSCFVKASPNTTGKFQLWCHDDIGIDPHGSVEAIPYATPSIEGEQCSLRFEAKYNSNIRIHLQYMPGQGQIEVSDIRIYEL